MFNKVLIEKWKWRLEAKSTRIWRDIILSKYANLIAQNQHCAVKSQSWCQRDLCKVCRKWDNVRWSDKHTIWKVGFGKFFQFLDDKWLGEANLKQIFPMLYSISNYKRKTIRELGCWSQND